MISDWLHAELETAQAEFDSLEKQETEQDFPIGLTMERKYWNGYLDAITNAINELEGMN